MQFRVKLTGGHETDFVEHAAKVNNVADLVFW
jgi:hypothetical protein